MIWELWSSQFVQSCSGARAGGSGRGCWMCQSEDVQPRSGSGGWGPDQGLFRGRGRPWDMPSVGPGGGWTQAGVWPPVTICILHPDSRNISWSQPQTGGTAWALDDKATKSLTFSLFIWKWKLTMKVSPSWFREESYCQDKHDIA